MEKGVTIKKTNPIYEDNEFDAMSESLEDEVKVESAEPDKKKIQKTVSPGKNKKESKDVKNIEEAEEPENKKNVQIFEEIHHRAKRYTTDNKLMMKDYICELLDKDLKKKGY